MVLQARAKAVPLGVYAAGHPPSTVGVHQRKYSSTHHRIPRDRMFTLTSTSMYTSSTHTTTIITDQYDATFCLDCGKDYADRFLICFQLEITISDRIRIEDDLTSTYRHYTTSMVLRRQTSQCPRLTSLKSTQSLPTWRMRIAKRPSAYVEVQEMLRTT